jgi:hypothetical protein
MALKEKKDGRIKDGHVKKGGRTYPCDLALGGWRCGFCRSQILGSQLDPEGPRIGGPCPTCGAIVTAPDP